MSPFYHHKIDTRVHLQLDPEVVLLGNHLDLHCNYQLETALYSIKFYHNGHEFFRYIPRDSVPVTIFPRQGLWLDETQNFHNRIRLIRVTKETEGLIKCEVSSEGPVFETHSDEMQLLVTGIH